jgi:prepilin-type N-terminal cleavage/methylation domain-containing protein
MNDRPHRRSSGFTLIEIVLVLAIGSIILTLVFIAISGTQKARRDAERERIAAELMGHILSFTGNNNGVHPENQAQLDEVFDAYLADRKDPGTLQPYELKYSLENEANHDTLPVEGQILYGREHFCEEGNGTILDDTGAHWHGDHFLIIYQEQGGYYCLDNKTD